MMSLLVLHLKIFIHLTFMRTTRISPVQIIFFVRKSRLHMTLKSFPEFGTRLWNCLLFKLLLTVLENYYVDARSLILNLNTIIIRYSYQLRM